MTEMTVLVEPVRYYVLRRGTRAWASSEQGYSFDRKVIYMYMMIKFSLTSCSPSIVDGFLSWKSCFWGKKLNSKSQAHFQCSG